MVSENCVLDEFTGKFKSITEDEFNEEGSTQGKCFHNYRDYSHLNYLNKKLSNNLTFSLYKVYISTGDQPDADTSSPIYLTFLGDQLISEPQTLKKRNKMVSEKLQRGSTKRFFIKAPKFQKLNFAIIQFESEKHNDGWFLKDIKIEEVGTHRKWYSKCYKWFSEEKEEGVTCRILNLSNDMMNIDYRFAIEVSNTNAKGFTLPLYLKLFGSAKTSKKISLENQMLRSRNEPYNFLISAPDVGVLQKLRIGICDTKQLETKKNYKQSILMKKISIICSKDNSMTYSLTNETWIKFNSDQEKFNRTLIDLKYSFEDLQCGSNIDLNAHPNEETIFYDIMIWKYDPQYLNESSKIFVKFFGQTKSWSIIYEISDKKRFAGNDVDIYRVIGKNVGSIKKIRLWHNKAGMSSAWHLNKVKIIRQLTNREIYLTIAIMKRQGRLQHGMNIADGRIIFKPLEKQINLPQTSMEIPQNFPIRKIMNESGDNADSYMQRKQNNPCELGDIHNVNSTTLSLPYAEESIFYGQSWFTLEGDKTVYKTLSVDHTKIINSPVKLTLR